jgi:hypothetical protein
VAGRTRGAVPAQFSTPTAVTNRPPTKARGHDFWVGEMTLDSDQRTIFQVIIFEFRGSDLIRETEYFAEPLHPSKRVTTGPRAI